MFLGMGSTINCSCGTADHHEVARATSFDGVTVCLWSDGGLTGRLGRYIKGLPARPRTANAIAAGRLFLQCIDLYEQREFAQLYKAARKACRLDAQPGTVRRFYSEASRRDSRPSVKWEVLRTDSRGKATERVTILPRLRWPGLVVFDFCGGPGSASGRYQLFSRDGDCARPTGFAFRNLADLWSHLEGLS